MVTLEGLPSKASGAVCIDILDFSVRDLVTTHAVQLPMDRLELPHDRVEFFTRLAIIGK